MCSQVCKLINELISELNMEVVSHQCACKQLSHPRCWRWGAYSSPCRNGLALRILAKAD